MVTKDIHSEGILYLQSLYFSPFINVYLHLVNNSNSMLYPLLSAPIYNTDDMWSLLPYESCPIIIIFWKDHCNVLMMCFLMEVTSRN